MPIPTIRSATSDDARRIGALLESLSYTYLKSPTPAEAEAFFETLREPAIRALLARRDTDYLVAEASGAQRLAGAAGMRYDGTLVHLFVDPLYQGRGLGRRLWELLRDRAMERGHPGRFSVYSSTAAVPVYERFGFQVSGAPVEKNGGVSVPMVCTIVGS
jgi:GNAT superfamily N-acetyltransferase